MVLKTKTIKINVDKHYPKTKKIKIQYDGRELNMMVVDLTMTCVYVEGSKEEKIVLDMLKDFTQIAPKRKL